jgi:hypothetical protein
MVDHSKHFSDLTKALWDAKNAMDNATMPPRTGMWWKGHHIEACSKTGKVWTDGVEVPYLIAYPEDHEFRKLCEAITTQEALARKDKLNEQRKAPSTGRTTSRRKENWASGRG